jgi:3-methylcrotonyl-CoA carboxylase alpha subunit
MTRRVRTLLVANRGEIACRVIRSARSLGLRTVAVYSEADANAMHVALADSAIAIGGAKPADSYLRVAAILDAARDSHADAVHPGYGFLAENEDFAEAVQSAGLVWVGPDPKTMQDMGDKERARLLAKAAGVPVLPGSARFAPGDLDGLEDAADDVGYPLLVKASAGGGGIGMRLVEDPAGLRKTVEATQGLAARSFGDGTVFLERYVRQARHVEMQVFGFGDGHAVHCFERECSIQRRFQKIVEESPSPGLSADAAHAMAAAATALVKQERYRSAGTIEFVLDDDTGAFYFLEMNTRIQVEHPVTEMLTGLDLVAMQLRLAMGEPLGDALHQDDVRRGGHAIEVRICAENPAKMFLPSPGRITKLALPAAGDGVRVDTGVREGDTVTPYYDSLLAKLIVHAADREAAVGKMLAALDATAIEGIATNVAFLRRVIDHAAFRAGRTLTGFVDAHKADLIGERGPG